MGEREAVVALADHPARAFKVQTIVFLPATQHTWVRLARGERLFVMTDRELSEAPYTGPDNVMIATEHFGCWPVVAVIVRDVHAKRWRSITEDDRARMMARIRRQPEVAAALARSKDIHNEG